MTNKDINELSAQIAEAVRASLKADLDEIKQLLESLEQKLEENTVTTAFLAKDVYMLKNRAK